MPFTHDIDHREQITEGSMKIIRDSEWHERESDQVGLNLDH